VLRSDAHGLSALGAMQRGRLLTISVWRRFAHNTVYSIRHARSTPESTPPDEREFVVGTCRQRAPTMYCPFTIKYSTNCWASGACLADDF
jgi:hypothetical protein